MTCLTCFAVVVLMEGVWGYAPTVQEQTGASNAEVGQLVKLRYRTAWIFLGVLDVDTGNWGSQPKHLIWRERDRLVSPAGRPTTKDDLTGFNLAVDVVVRVCERTTDPETNGLQGIWVRVVPYSDKGGQDCR
jgi:hypothetical protein